MQAVQALAAFFSPPPRKVGFESVLALRSQTTPVLLINTLPSTNQSCLIAGTLECANEEARINAAIRDGSAPYTEIIVYGMHACDSTPETKLAQLLALGFSRAAVYPGGMFEYLLLQDVFGATMFPTRGCETDLLRYRPPLSV